MILLITMIILLSVHHHFLEPNEEGVFTNTHRDTDTFLLGTYQTCHHISITQPRVTVLLLDTWAIIL